MSHISFSISLSFCMMNLKDIQIVRFVVFFFKKITSKLKFIYRVKLAFHILNFTSTKMKLNCV